MTTGNVYTYIGESPEWLYGTKYEYVDKQPLYSHGYRHRFNRVSDGQYMYMYNLYEDEWTDNPMVIKKKINKPNIT